MTALICSVQRRKIFFEIRNTLFRRRDILRKALFNHTDAGNEEDMRCELKRIEVVLEQMRRGTYGKCQQTGVQIPSEYLLADPFSTTVV
jgi:RNA polymerase-binding transcription factor DksA